MVHIIFAVLFGIVCGVFSMFGVNLYMRAGNLLGFALFVLGFILAFKFTMTATIPIGFIQTRNSPFVKNAHVLLGWTIVALIGIWIMVVPALRGD